MARLAFVLFCLVILIQFHGFLSQYHQEIDTKAIEVRRFKRCHESDRVQKSVKTNNHNKSIDKNDNVDASVKSPTKSNVIEKPIIKQEHKEESKPNILKHVHGTSKKGKSLSTNKVHEMKVSNNNDSKESTKDKPPKDTSEKPTIKLHEKNKKESDVQLKNKIVVTTKENKINDDKSNNSDKNSISKADCSEDVTKENNIMEIEEHKYEELIRDNPTKYCSQLDARHWEYFNTGFHGGLFIQENTYEQMRDTFENFDPEFLYAKNVNQGRGKWYYTDLNTENYSKANLDFNVIKKTWLDRQIKIKVPKKEETVTNDQRYLKNGYESEKHALSIISSYNPSNYQYIKYT